MLCHWVLYCGSRPGLIHISTFMFDLSVMCLQKKEPKKDEGGKFIELPGAKMGEVVVRFPPEASG